MSITNNYADIIEFIGTGANSNGNIQLIYLLIFKQYRIAFLQVYAEGTPIPG